MLNKMNAKQLAVFLADNGGRIDVNQLSDDEYTLKAKVHGKGGGIILGQIMYWGTKTLAYGTLVGGVTAGLVATGGAAGAGLATLVTSSASVSTATAGAIIATAAPEAAMAATSVAFATTAPAAIVAGIEAASVGAAALGTACWFLP